MKSSATCRYWARASLNSPCWVYSSASFKDPSTLGCSLVIFLYMAMPLTVKPCAGIGIAHHLEALDGFGVVAQTRVEIADGVVDGKILDIVLQDLFVLSNGALQLALLDKLFRGAENLLFIETKTKRHRVRTPAFFPPNARVFLERCPTGPNLAGRFPGETPQTAQSGSRNKLIVRPRTLSSMVTDDYRGYRKGVYVRFRKTLLPASRMGATNRQPDPGRAPLYGVFCYLCVLNFAVKEKL